MHERLVLTLPEEVYALLNDLGYEWALSVQGAAKRLIMEGLTKAAEEGLCLPVEIAPRTRRPGGGRKVAKNLNANILDFKGTGATQTAVARQFGVSQAHVSHIWRNE